MVFLGMLAESALLAATFGLVIGTITAQLLGSLHVLAITDAPLQQMPWATRLMLSLGAGLYEELFFRVVLVTGVSRYLGTRLASALAADPSIERVIGVDTVAPRAEVLPQLGRTEFVRADIRNPLIAKVIAQAEVDTVVHMNVIATPLGAGGRTAMKEINVIGTMQLLAACQKAPSMRKAFGLRLAG